MIKVNLDLDARLGRRRSGFILELEVRVRIWGPDFGRWTPWAMCGQSVELARCGLVGLAAVSRESSRGFWGVVDLTINLQ